MSGRLYIIDMYKCIYRLIFLDAYLSFYKYVSGWAFQRCQGFWTLQSEHESWGCFEIVKLAIVSELLYNSFIEKFLWSFSPKKDYWLLMKHRRWQITALAAGISLRTAAKPRSHAKTGPQVRNNYMIIWQGFQLVRKCKNI